MVNSQEFYCNYCKENTIFFLESDLVWYCNECGNPLHSIPWEEIDEEDLEMEEDSEIIRCPLCHNLISLDSLELGYLCPVCFEDLSDELYELEDEEDEDEDEEGQVWD